ncbi:MULTISPECIES: acyl carrier protein [Helicobacter]|uniref:Phosphopantetheine-binding protein n=1 Tax=Helicobacter ibis TaxID=2962633 RepID=A0ABT4VFR3_9HELI|nr:MULTISPECIES: phosphopantetheine-binding protein [Helicobacter]MDA3967890.1 phosphopantetheine-binding protein [Helicobacter sp. WB40]MDA3969556.1 phosphopantetheine-binding protein [Helicobacter ibis]
MKEKIENFIKTKNPNFDGGAIFGNNGIDSVGFLELLSFLEDELKIELDFSEYDPVEFGTLNGLYEIIKKENLK